MTLMELRKTKKISQKKLAEQVGVSQAYICALDVEIERIPARRVIKAIAKSLGIRASKVLEALEEADVKMGRKAIHQQRNGCSVNWHNPKKRQSPDKRR